MDEKFKIDKMETINNCFKPHQRNVNIEALLLMAKYNSDFQKKLLQNRDIAIKESDIDLSDAEAKIIKSIDTSLLKQYVNNFSVKGITRRSLKNWACAASIVMLLSSLFIKCGDKSSGSEDDDPYSYGGTPDKAYIENINSSTDLTDTEDIPPFNNSSE